MEVNEAILSRRSIRAYQKRPIGEEDLKEILEAGTYAPSAVNLQPWYFVAIRSPEQMDKLTEIMAQVSQKVRPSLEARFPTHPEVTEESCTFTRQLGGAPVCILVFPYKPDYAKTESTIVQSISAAIENILLVATAKGIGSCWLTAPIETGMGGELRDIFAPGKGELVALLTLGYPEKEAKAPARKKDRYIVI